MSTIYQASLLAFFTLLLTAKCRPIDDFDVNSYSFRYESKGVVRSEYGYFNGGIWTVVGYYTWLDPDGQLHRFSFTADDKGFRILPVGTPTEGRPAAYVPKPKPKPLPMTSMETNMHLVS